MAEGQETTNKITIFVKTPKDKHSIEIEENATIKDVSYYLFILYHIISELFYW